MRARRARRPRFVIAARSAGLAAALVATAAGGATAQATCLRDGDHLVCDDGRSFPIRSYPWERRSAPGLGLADPWTASPRSASGGLLAPDTAGDRYLHGPDGLVCVRHLDHVHCNR